MAPLEVYWPYLLIVSNVIFVNMLLTPFIEQLCSKIKFEKVTKTFNKIDR